MESLPPLSFNCTICFEKFSEAGHHPVVLPCGHTYLCAACADRLDKCMECGAELFTTDTVDNRSAADSSTPEIQQIQQASALLSTAADASTPEIQQASAHESEVSPSAEKCIATGSTANTSTSGHTKLPVDGEPSEELAEAPKKSRIPLPKNTVLLHLMDAHAKASRDTRVVFQRESSEATVKHDVLAEDTNIDCGTYSVVATNGLTIVPFPACNSIDAPIDAPLDQMERQESSSFVPLDSSKEKPVAQSSISDPIRTIKEDISSIFEGYRENRTLHKHDQSTNIRSNGLGTETSSKNEGMHLNYGDQIQVVSIENGWAKLGRGYGYVRCVVERDIVKISGCEDRACKLEGMLLHLASLAGDLLREQNKVQIHVLLTKYNYYYCCCVSKAADSAEKACKLEGELFSLSSRTDELLREQNEINAESNNIKKELLESLGKNDDLTVMPAEPTMYDMSWKEPTGHNSDGLSWDGSGGEDDDDDSASSYAKDYHKNLMDDLDDTLHSMHHNMDLTDDLDSTFHAIQAAGNPQGMDCFVCFSSQQLPPISSGHTTGRVRYEGALTVGDIVQGMLNI